MKHPILRHTLTTVAIALVLVVAAPVGITAQNTSPNSPPKRPNWDGALEIRFPIPATCPPLTTDMPLDVLIGYVGADSLARSISLAQADSLRRAIVCSAPLRQAMKYLYAMADYDPIRLFQWTGQAQSGQVHYPVPIAHLRTGITLRARIDCPDTQRTAVLHAADIIAYVHVTATQTKIDTNAVDAKHATLVTCTIIDPIKGEWIPNCWIDSRTKARDRSAVSAVVPMARAEGSQTAVPGACLQFEISPEWELHGGKHKPRDPSVGHQTNLDSSLADGFAGNPGPWVQPNVDYVVFLRLVGLGTDSVRNDDHYTRYQYATIFPITWFGYTCSLYPVVNGTVYDPHNDFGFGTNLTPSQFVAALRSRISSITNP